MADLLNDEQIAEFKDVFVIFDQGISYANYYFQMIKQNVIQLEIKNIKRP